MLPHVHVILAYLSGPAFVPNALTHVEGFIPSEDIAILLDTLRRSVMVESRFGVIDFPQYIGDIG
jgi:hypothetical protein